MQYSRRAWIRSSSGGHDPFALTFVRLWQNHREPTQKTNSSDLVETVCLNDVDLCIRASETCPVSSTSNSSSCTFEHTRQVVPRMLCARVKDTKRVGSNARVLSSRRPGRCRGSRLARIQASCPKCSSSRKGARGPENPRLGPTAGQGHG